MVDELDVVAGLERLFASRAGDVVVGIGDDAAVLRCGGAHLVAACDPVVEGVHFDGAAPPGAVGRKAVHRNVSDLAAMGARPRFLLVSALLPRGLPPARRLALFRGVRAAADACGCVVVGGDVSGTPGPLALVVTALGWISGRVLRRADARPGDLLYVTGPLGGAGSGRHLRFRPAVAEGRWLTRHAATGGVIDVSDGLLADLARMLEASGGLGAELVEEAVPIAPAARRLARHSGRSALEHALTDGEDHVLLFSWRSDRPLPRRAPWPAACRRPIGVVRPRPGLWLRGRDGRRRRLRARGWRHVL